MKNALLKPLAALLPMAVMLLIPIYSHADDYHFADVNRDGEVTLSDVNAVIDVILGYAVDPPQENEDKTFMANGVSFKMVKVKGGMFIMGAADDDPDAFADERPTRMVRLSDYYIGETEVTQELWEAVMGTQPSAFSGNKSPVERVSWEDCKEFIRRLNTITGMHFRLPTEAEWEFAARGGNKSNGYLYAGSNNINEVACCTSNNINYTTLPAGSLSPNELGIYDMSGNVFEWCEDWYGGYPAPLLSTSTNTIFLDDIPQGATQTSASFTISGYQLSEDVYITVQGDGFSISRQFIGVREANTNSIPIVVTYSGPRNQSAEGVITITSKNAQDKTVSLRYHCPSLEIISDNPIKFENLASTSATFTVIGHNLSGDIILDVYGDGFSVTPSTISSDDGNVTAYVSVSYDKQLNIVPVNGEITVYTNGLPAQTINLIAQLKPSLDIIPVGPIMMEDSTSTTAKFTVFGHNLIEDVTFTIDNEEFSLSPLSISPDNNGVVNDAVTVTYLGYSLGMEPVVGTIKISSTGLEKTLEVIAQQKSDSDSQENNNVSMQIRSNSTNSDYQGYVDVNPNGPSSGLYRIMRGGAWNSQNRFCRSSYRFSRETTFKNSAVGMRLAM